MNEINATREAVQAARPGCRVILAGLRGSKAHGTYVEPLDELSTDDIYTFAVWVMPPAHYFSTSSYGKTKADGYETAGETLDVSAYDIRKFLHLLSVGNPNVHSWLWTDGVYASVQGMALVETREALLSQRILTATAGYATAQLRKMKHRSKLGYMGTKRDQLRQRFGYDIKNAAHCVRLLYMGIHLAKGEGLLVRLPDRELVIIKDIKAGRATFDEVVEVVHDLEAQFDSARTETELPKDPPTNLLDDLAVAIIEDGAG